MEAVSEFKIETALLQVLVFVRVEAEQLRWAMASSHLCFLERNEQAEAQDFFAEIPLVQLSLQHRLVEVLELRERELRWQQLEPDGLVTHLAFESGARSRQNVGVVESELGHFRDRKPT